MDFKANSSTLLNMHHLRIKNDEMRSTLKAYYAHRCSSELLCKYDHCARFYKSWFNKTSFDSGESRIIVKDVRRLTFLFVIPSRNRHQNYMVCSSSSQKHKNKNCKKIK